MDDGALAIDRQKISKSWSARRIRSPFHLTAHPSCDTVRTSSSLNSRASPPIDTLVRQYFHGALATSRSTAALRKATACSRETIGRIRIADFVDDQPGRMRVRRQHVREFSVHV
jgi:hypothetical protein